MTSHARYYGKRTTRGIAQRRMIPPESVVSRKKGEAGPYSMSWTIRGFADLSVPPLPNFSERCALSSPRRTEGFNSISPPLLEPRVTKWLPLVAVEAKTDYIGVNNKLLMRVF